MKYDTICSMFFLLILSTDLLEVDMIYCSYYMFGIQILKKNHPSANEVQLT